MKRNKSEKKEVKTEVIKVQEKDLEELVVNMMKVLDGTKGYTMRQLSAVVLHALASLTSAMYTTITKKIMPDGASLKLLFLVLNEMLDGDIQIQALMDDKDVDEMLNAMTRDSKNPALEKLKDDAMKILMQYLSEQDPSEE